MTMFIKVFAGMLTALQTPVTGPTTPLSLEEAAGIAEHNAFAVRLQLSRTEQGRQQVELARAGLLPTANASYSLSHLPQPVIANFGGAPTVLQQQDNRTISGQLVFPIDIFGNANRRVSASRASLRSAKNTLQAARNDVRLGAKSSFLNVLRAKASVGVAEQAVKDATERLNQSRQLLAGEQIARVDVIRLEAQLEASRADLLVAQNNLSIQSNAFNLALARPIETPVNLQDVPQLPAAPTDPAPLAEAAQAKRAEVLALRDQISALASTRRALEGGLNPTFNVGVNYARNLDAAGFSQKEQTTAVLTLNLPVFDGGATRARVRSARQDEEQAKINLEQTQLSISQEVRNAVTALVTARARLSSAEAQIRAAEEVYRLAQVRQNAGAENTYVEVIDALTQLVQARNTGVSARYDYLVAFSQLQRAVGSDDLASATGTGAASPNGGGSR